MCKGNDQSEVLAHTITEATASLYHSLSLSVLVKATLVITARGQSGQALRPRAASGQHSGLDLYLFVIVTGKTRKDNLAQVKLKRLERALRRLILLRSWNPTTAAAAAPP